VRVLPGEPDTCVSDLVHSVRRRSIKTNRKMISFARRVVGIRINKWRKTMAKNVPAPKAPAKLPVRPYVGDPSFNSPVHPKAKGHTPSQKMPANSGVKKA